jgi:hypothetical protein
MRARRAAETWLSRGSKGKGRQRAGANRSGTSASGLHARGAQPAFPHERHSGSVNRRFHHHFLVIKRKGSIDVHDQVSSALAELPCEGDAAREVVADANMVPEIMLGVRDRMFTKIRRGCGHGPSQLDGEAHSDHVLGDPLSEADSSMVAIRNDVHEPLKRGRFRRVRRCRRLRCRVRSCDSAKVIIGPMIRVQGIAVGSRASFEAMNRAIMANGVKLDIDRTFPLTEAAAAFRHLQDVAHGKIGVDALTDLQSIVCRRGPAEPASRGKESDCREPQESRWANLLFHTNLSARTDSDASSTECQSWWTGDACYG